MTENGYEPALLALSDGSVFRGRSIGTPGSRVGEVVFNTAMTGYQEILTDPSYSRQMVTLTYPHIGNTGTNPEDSESSSVQAAGLIVRDCPRRASNWRSDASLPEYLAASDTVAIGDIDTRRLTRILREKGAMPGCIVTGSDIDQAAAVDKANAFPGLKGMDLAQVVSTRRAYRWDQGSYDLDAQSFRQSDGRFHVVALDFGIKHNILRMLADRGCSIDVLPATASFDEVMALSPDGVFLSNGPGDPEPCDYAIKATRQLIDSRLPLFGICLGLQILGLASGARTHKMKFGHHGANHPVQDLTTGQVMISSQNHGFAVDEQSLPQNVKATHRSLFDGSLQGIALADAPAFGFQGHPEASPGPHDLAPLFDQFIALMKQHQRTGAPRHA